MSQTPSTPCPARRAGGFTLIEVLIALAIASILVAVALPSYRDSIRKGRRAEAFKAISAVQQAQERWRSRFTSYATDAQLTLGWADSPPGLGLQASTPSGYYGITISASDAKGYVVTATAAGSQTSDTRCAVMAAKLNDGNLSYGSGTDAVDWADPNRCWAR